MSSNIYWSVNGGISIYSIISKSYDLLDIIYFKSKGKNPREIIKKNIPEGKNIILDMACGTFSNGFHIAMNNPSSIITGIDMSSEMLKKQEKIF